MEKFEGTMIREKIYNQLMMAQPSKFQHDRWGLVLGCRSGTIGTFDSFSEAIKPRPKHPKKRKNHNIIQ